MEIEIRSTGQRTTTALGCTLTREEEMGTEGKLNLQQERDYTSLIPDECLSCIFSKFGAADRNQCSLVCKRWHWVESQGRQGLSLTADSELVLVLPTLFRRFENITKLALKWDKKSTGISDRALLMVGQYCLQLKKLKLKGCLELTDDGMELFSKVCGGPLKKLSCGSCGFGSRGVSSILQHCSVLEDLSVKRLRGLADGPSSGFIGPGCGKIRRLRLKKLIIPQLFGPLIAGSRSLHTLMLCNISGNWDNLLGILTEHVPQLLELHIERLHLSDLGLQAVAKCTSLEVLYVLKTPECTNYGLSAIADGCRQLRKLHVDGWKSNQVGDEGLLAVSRNCRNLQELVLVGTNATAASLDLIASNCLGLERLALCSSDTVGDLELSCIAVKCHALKKLCIKSCPISDQGLKGLASGCPDLQKVKVKKCRGVTYKSALWLQVHRTSLIVSFDSDVQTVEHEGTTTSEGPSQAVGTLGLARQSQPPLRKIRLALLAGRSFVARTFFRQSSPSGL